MPMPLLVQASSQLDLIDSLQPCYTAPWPLGLVVTEAALQKYYGLHRCALALPRLGNDCSRAKSAFVTGGSFEYTSSGFASVVSRCHSTQRLTCTRLT